MERFKTNKSLSYSLAIHFGLFTLWMVLIKMGPLTSFSPDEKVPTTTWIEVVPNLKNIQEDTRIVDSAKVKPSKDAAKDAFLGERTQVVDVQKVVQSPMLGVKPSIKAPPSKARSKPKPAEENKIAQTTTIPSLSQLGVKMNLTQVMSQERAPIEEAIEEEGSLNAQAGGEYVKGYKAGDQTLLNTKEYVFYGYFQRIRQSLDKAWDKSLKTQMDKYFRRGRQLASETDYITQLMVVLNNDGQIVRIQVISQSGTKDLDDASVKAFNSAGPFPNPPKGLVDKTGQIKIRWDFVVKT